MENNVTWIGKSGKAYPYRVCRTGTRLESMPANFILAKETRPGLWFPLYIGTSQGWSEEVVNPALEAWEKSHGELRIHVGMNPGGEADIAAEALDLSSLWSSPGNAEVRARDRGFHGRRPINLHLLHFANAVRNLTVLRLATLLRQGFWITLRPLL